MRTTDWLVLSCVLCMAVACDSGDTGPGPDAGAPDSGSAGALRVATYNAGLLDSVGYVPERAPLAIKALAELDADVLCVQEFWQQKHWDALVEANAEMRPHVLRPDPEPGVQGQCTADEFAPVRSCSQEHCADAGPSDLVSCTAANCATEVAAVSASCVTCLLDNGSSGNFDAIESACVGASSAKPGESLPPDERSYSQGGSFGIGLLSRYPFTQTDIRVLDSSAVRRGILYARIDTPEFGEISVFCTHPTPDLPSTTYDGSYGSWKGENAAHIDSLIEWAHDKAAGKPTIVLGDLNTGPAGDHIEPELPDSYAKLPAAGFDDPFADSSDAACTFCPDNVLVMSGDTGVGAMIDHVLLRDLDAKVTVKRILTDEVPLESDETDAGAANVPAALPRSDHYGLQGSIRPTGAR